METVKNALLEATAGTATEFFNNADAHPFEGFRVGTLKSLSRKRTDWFIQRGRVHGVVTSDSFVKHRGIEHGTGAGTYLVKRRCHSNYAVAGYRTVGRFYAYRTGEGGRLANRSTCISSKS